TEQVPNKEIANRLSISPPTVTEMMNSLVKAGWVVYTPYKGSKLTREGTDYAKKLIRKHRLWEVFLVKHLGFNIHEVHPEAELLEHSTSAELEQAGSLPGFSRILSARRRHLHRVDGGTGSQDGASD